MLRSFDPSWLGLIISWPPRRKRLQDLSRVLVPLTWDLEVCTVLLKTAVSNSILRQLLSPTSQAQWMLCIAHVSYAHHYCRCCQPANSDWKTLLSADGIMPLGECSVCLWLCEYKPRTVHTLPSFALCHVHLREFYELSASSHYFH